MEKKLIFISHITEEKELAFLLKSHIEKAFLGTVEVFVSSHHDSVSPGDRWLDKLSKALSSCVVELVLCSPASVNRPWIQFETGAAWSQNIPIIPLCHSGAAPATNPVPLSELQGVMINQKPGLDNMMVSIAKHIGINVPENSLDELVRRIMDFEENYTIGDSMIKFFDAIGGSRTVYKKLLELNPTPNSLNMDLGSISNDDFSVMKSLLTSNLKKFFSFSSRNPELLFYKDRMQSQIDVVLHINALSQVLDYLGKELA